MIENMWLFGAGNFGKEYVSKYGKIFCKGFIDNDSAKWGKKVNGLKVYKYDDFKYIYHKNDTICITCAKVDEVYLQLQEDGLGEAVMVYLPERGVIPGEELWGQRIYSQLGEDIGLMHYFSCKGWDDDYKGFYLDIGAYHPFRGNNTLWAYKKGWRGMNIDANEESIRLFRAFRPDDINVNCGVSDRSEELEYYMFQGAAGMNTFAHERKNVKEIENVKLLKVRNINDILEEYQIKTIDFVDIDVEGTEEKIVRTFNWKKYNPKCALIEFLGKRSIEEVLQTPIHEKMREEGYFLKSFYTVTALYIKND